MYNNDNNNIKNIIGQGQNNRKQFILEILWDISKNS